MGVVVADEDVEAGLGLMRMRTAVDARRRRVEAPESELDRVSGMEADDDETENRSDDAESEKMVPSAS